MCWFLPLSYSSCSLSKLPSPKLIIPQLPGICLGIILRSDGSNVCSVQPKALHSSPPWRPPKAQEKERCWHRPHPTEHMPCLLEQPYGCCNRTRSRIEALTEQWGCKSWPVEEDWMCHKMKANGMLRLWALRQVRGGAEKLRWCCELPFKPSGFERGYVNLKIL